VPRQVHLHPYSRLEAAVLALHAVLSESWLLACTCMVLVKMCVCAVLHSTGIQCFGPPPDKMGLLLAAVRLASHYEQRRCITHRVEHALAQHVHTLDSCDLPTIQRETQRALVPYELSVADMWRPML
jgi:hypothetical protein